MTALNSPGKAVAHDPRLPTLEEVMTGSPFDIVDSPWGHIERWRASTLATGTMGALAHVAAIVRNDAAELEKQAVALDAKKHAVLSTINRIVKFMSRVDALTARVDALEARHRADAEEKERQRLFQEEPLALPPGENQPEPAQVKDDEPPIGISKDPGELPEPSLELEDALGDLPEKLRDLPDPPAEPKGSVLPQPTALFGS
jgi:hypothetical protein